jgi:hypothetical protein
MNETTRTTRQCLVNELNPVLITAMRAHVAEYNLGDLETSIMMCCETTSIRQKRGLFGSAETSLSSVFVTPRWLVWAENSNGKKSAGSAQLRNIDVRNYEETAMFAIAPDQGLNVTGRYTNINQTGQVFIGIGDGPDGQKFRQLLRETMKKTEAK